MNIFDKILMEVEMVTSVLTALPTPLAPGAAIAFTIEKIFGAALSAHSAASGKSVDEIIKGLHQIAPV